MIRSTVWILCLIWMANAIGAYAGVSKRRDLSNSKGNGLRMPMAKAYYAVNEKKTWDQARATCQELGGDLAQIRTVEDQKHVQTFLLSVGRSVGAWGSAYNAAPAWWIGATRWRHFKNPKRMWRWVDGDKVSKDIAYVWDKKGQDTDEHCLSIHRVPKWPEAGFSSGRCHEDREFVCEKYEDWN